MNSQVAWFWKGYQGKWNQTVKDFDGLHSGFNTSTLTETTKFVFVCKKNPCWRIFTVYGKKIDVAMKQAKKKRLRDIQIYTEQTNQRTNSLCWYLELGEI